MTADPVRPQETLREAVRDAAMPPLHQLEVRISGLNRDCACGIVAEVVADAVLPIVEEATKPLVEEIEEFAVELAEERTEHQALRDKVKALADAAEVLIANLDGGVFGQELRHYLRALVEEPQGGEQ